MLAFFFFEGPHGFAGCCLPASPGVLDAAFAFEEGAIWFEPEPLCWVAVVSAGCADGAPAIVDMARAKAAIVDFLDISISSN